ncbi:GNAT family N-acetyltransferase [Streptomyces sp. S186]|uniref:GNAT family N-acetyltransferase n=1 Tax=Streptomyces sp. S186 TaxID=3434395 RepID=UPI003F667A20
MFWNIEVEDRLFEVRLLDGAGMRSCWDEVERMLRKAFESAQYNDEGYSIENPVHFTRAGVDGELGPGVKHVVAIENGALVGGFFCLPTRPNKGEKSCDVGWVFLAPDLPRAYRRGVLDAIMERGFQTVKDGGFERIVSNMGTMAGSRALTRYGFVHSPVPGRQNRWVKEL